MFKQVNPRQSFPEMEKNIRKFWKEENIFQTSLENRKDSKEFEFYDGPPFATGLPHYGHILAGTIKDIIPRYKTMQGFKVDRKFGWDCHGLPVENLIEKKLGLSNKQELMDYGIGKFNEECRGSVMKYTSEWKETVEKMGRWVEFDGGYKTMDTDFMESVWATFKAIWDKKDEDGNSFVYEGNKPMHICPRCVTPLSNFEVNQGYKDLTDISVTSKFRINNNKCDHEIDFLAWTTTPWTLPGNVALAVGEEIEYSFMKKGNHVYVLATDTLPNFEKELEGYELLHTRLGKQLVEAGLKYDPIFNYFEEEKNNGGFKLVIGDFVTTDSGTGIVHIAPAFGEDDMKLGKENNLPFIQHVGMDGKFVEKIQKDFGEDPVKEKKDNMKMDRKIIEFLEKEDKVFQKKNLKHSYPTCWRCDTPLLNYATKTWFIAVEKVKDKLLANNQKINWTPDHLKNGRFGKWLEGARDWAVSRNRYWGTPLPIWRDTEGKTFECIGNIEELYQGNKEFGDIEKKEINGKTEYFFAKDGKNFKKGDKIDLHKHLMDEIKIKKDGKTLSRVEEVFDCWFESGSMPYAQKHFLHDKEPEFALPADFIAEGLDQTRGWFYTLHVISTILYDKPAFKNVIVNGMVLAEDGKKMSKSLQNYPDPNEMFEKYGADIIRFYLMSSPVVNAADLRFSERGLEEVMKSVMLPLWNSYSFFTMYANIDGIKIGNLDKGNITFVRHGETENNVKGIVNGLDDNLDLNRVGIQQAHDLGKKLKNSGKKYDVIISSPMLRAKHTAKILKEYIDYEIEIIENEKFKVQSYGEFRGIAKTEIKEKYNCKTKGEIEKIYKNNSEENIEQYYNRVKKGYVELEKKYKGKNILLVAHSGTFRSINKFKNNLSIEDAFYILPTVKNATPVIFPMISNLTTLDKWILSELELAQKEITENMDNYSLSGATKIFSRFFDNITNWYIRRSRKRFWSKAGGQDQNDKEIAYNTLHYVLVETSKMLAPFCPFISEEIYKNLTGKESVHLENWTNAEGKFINETLSEKIETTQKIIGLGLGLRKKLKLKVRQPLQKAIIAMPNIDIQDQLETIKEELNVKELEFLEDASEIAEVVVLPNAKVLGPRFGKKVQEIIKAAKSGDYKKLENGNTEVCGEELSPEEIAIRFQGKDGKEVGAEGEIVVALDTELTPELKLEGLARDIIRQVAEMRKEVGYNITDRISLEISNKEVQEKFGEIINQETLSHFEEIENEDLKGEIEGVELKIFRKK